MLNFLEELLGAPIRGDKHEIADLDDVLQTPITVQLENTTVRQILKEVLAKADSASRSRRRDSSAQTATGGKPRNASGQIHCPAVKTVGNCSTFDISTECSQH